VADTAFCLANIDKNTKTSQIHDKTATTMADQWHGQAGYRKYPRDHGNIDKSINYNT